MVICLPLSLASIHTCILMVNDSRFIGGVVEVEYEVGALNKYYILE